MKTSLLGTLLLIATAVALRADHQPDHKTLVNRSRDGLAIQGYDPVAYFTQNRPVKGLASYVSRHGGVTYQFSDAANQARFEAEPERYTPAYGGFCGYAASVNKVSPISPEWFQIVEGRLVLQHNKKAFDKWNADLEGNLQRADQNWPQLVMRHGQAGSSLVFTDRKGVALGGYDPVSYFSTGMPTPGNPRIEGTYNGALYHFASEENRATFESDPSRYAPAYGGFCGYAASIGKVRPADPRLWSIVDGQLVVQHTAGAAQLWARDIAGNKAKADRLWPRLIQAKSGKKNPIDSLLGKSVLASLE